MRRLALVLVALWPMAAGAVQPNEILADPALEHRARDISAGLRCLVCQNQSIDDSDADLARDLRVIVRERLQQGDSDAQVRSFLVQRYGDFILLKPPLKTETLLLWLAPALVLLAGAAGLFALARRRTAAQPAALTQAEQERLRALLGDGSPDAR